MTSILTTVETDIGKAVSFIKTEAIEIGEAALTVVENVAKSAWTQTIALVKESHIGTAVLNAISAVEADGGDILAALPTIIADAKNLITELKTEGGSVIGGIEAEAEALASALVNDLKTDFLGNATVAAVASAVTSSSTAS